MSSLFDDKKNNDQTTIQQSRDSFKKKFSSSFNTINRIIKKNKNHNLNIIPHSRTKRKNFPIRNMSASILNQSNIENDSLFNKYINNNSIRENINNLAFNINESFNNKEGLHSLILKIGSNEKIDSEKNIVKKKLEEYLKLIDKKLNNISSTRQNHNNNINKTKTSTIRMKLFDKEVKFKSYININNHGNMRERIGKKIKYVTSKSLINIKRNKLQISSQNL